MKIKFLGTGGSMGVPELGCLCEVCTSKDNKDRRSRASVLVFVDGKRILIDCGPDFRRQMLKEEFSKLDAILITHEHYDHVSGIDDVRHFNRFGDIDIYTHPKTAEALRVRIPYCFAEQKYPGVPKINLHEVIEPFFLGEHGIHPILVMHHHLHIWGYRIREFAYLTDVKVLPETEYSKLQDLDVLIISALRHEPHMSHQTLTEAIGVAQRIGAKQTYFIHMCHQIGLHEKVQADLPSNMYLSYDGLEVELGGSVTTK